MSFWQLYRRNRSAVLGLIILVAVILMGALWFSWPLFGGLGSVVCHQDEVAAYDEVRDQLTLINPLTN